MKNIITSEIVVAYSHCSRKAFLLLFSNEKKEPHEYVCLLEKQASINQAKYLNALKQDNISLSRYDPDNIDSSSDFLIEATLKAHDLEAYCDVLAKVRGSSFFGKHSYEPTIVVGTQSITEELKIKLAFVGFVLGDVQKTLPISGSIVGTEMKTHKVKLNNIYKKLRPMIQTLKEWITTSPSESSQVILNRHCPYCQFQKECTEKAEKNDDLSLLSKMTPKIIRRYHKKGIFTVNQLSYSFKLRRKRKRKKEMPVRFNLELQALAIKTGKIYIQELPELHRHKVELFLDIEGIPDQNFYYLIGLLVCESDNRVYHSFWADTIQDEERIWSELIERINKYPEAPIYHYGSYEPRAIDRLTKRYQTNCDGFKKRLINVNSYIHGKVYFPVRSNNLKDLGKFIGASWTSLDASGLQSLVWRHRLEENQNSDYKQMLVTYNEEDCRALWLLTERLSEISETADSQANIDFADQPKQNTTERGGEIHRKFEEILRNAHADYNRNRISIQPKRSMESTKNKKRGAQKGHQGYKRIIPSSTGKVIRVPMRRKCPIHKGVPLHRSEETAKKIIIDLHFTKNGYRKTVTEYVGTNGYCKRCGKYYTPHGIQKLSRQLFGYYFQGWVIYQRIILRLPYRVINQVTEDIFGERMSEGTILSFISHFAQFYIVTDNILIRRILESPFIHVDETRLNIQGTDYYVWVFTDGKHVVFRMTETRETTIVQEFMSNYEGILISDFYPGYDSVPCRQQKCWVHLIRDINNDLWSAPFDTEFESFVFEVKNLIIPIFEAVDKYGLKKRHLNMFKKSVEQFYKENIVDMDYRSEVTIKYQKRFQRYKDSLFMFLEQDSIPWNNNMAERAIRHLAIQRKISGTFFKDTAPQYLLLLGIAQTCRFQDKSFLKFLISKKIDIDKFRSTKRINISTPVISPRDNEVQ
ncbi:TM0106 family RecB-like putative nuclease [Candidatus Methanoperedens nitratireducens]|uniref:Putative RecB family nuclease n=1 Tax=Candidatus Methanoperedens nitratireducens TaxID=1392998 RepID=A0A284VPV2_9EURY|nr:TM0106 family RecB-like putative nuclease [Candidatus Methanoperedens nitroreducens]SNQ61207.1 putative RecB family nuclease [Candidatus Methanoperedens nitroreducens]